MSRRAMFCSVCSLLPFAFNFNALPCAADPDESSFGGTLVFASGETLRVERFTRLFPIKGQRVGVLKVRHDTVLRTITLADVARLTFVKRELGGSYVDPGDVLTLQLRSGVEATVIVDERQCPCVIVEYVDKLTNKLQEQSFDANDKKNPIAELVFSDDIGTLKWSAESKQYFPPSFNFDPYTGAQLAWRTPSQNHAPTLQKRIWACPACRAPCERGPAKCPHCGSVNVIPAKTNLLEKGADYFLRRARIETGGGRAKAAKRFSAAWLNPFATESEIDRALHDVLANLEKP